MPRCARCQTGYGADFLLCPADGTELVGLLDGRYRVERLLGEGGMGRVYQAEHVGLKKRVALKVLRGELGAETTVVARFQQEAIAASQMGDPRIIEVTDFGRTPEGAFYSAMEWVDGQTLDEALQRSGPMPSAKVVALLEQLALALQVAHRHGIVHRDLKPQNVMVVHGTEQRLKLLDFGVSKVLGRERPLTEAGLMLGTAAYMAPEQINAEAVDARADVYALGAVAYELLTGAPPFRKQGTVAVLLQHLNDPVERPSLRMPRAQIAPELEALVLRMLQKRPDDRPRSMDEVLSTLRTIQPPGPGGGGAASAEGRPTRVGPPDGATLLGTQLARGRRRRVLGAVAIGLVGLGALGAWVWWPAVRPEQGGKSDGAVSAASGAPVAQTAPAANQAPPAGLVAERPASSLRIQTTPPGATVRQGAEVLGVTPLELERPRAPRLLTLELGGYQPVQLDVSEHTGPVEVVLAKSPDRAQTRERTSGPRRAPAHELKPNPF